MNFEPPAFQVNIIDADGRQNTIEYVPVEDVSLEDLPEPEPLAIGTSCVACGSVADGLKCPDCGAAFCSRECFKREWKGHKRGCREAQAQALGRSWRGRGVGASILEWQR